MENNEIEIFVAPIKAYWLGLPDDSNNRQTKIELLKQDVLILPCDLPDLDLLNYNE